MHKQLKRADLYFRTVLYTTEELLTSADFKALDNYVLSELKQDVRVYTAAVKLPRELYIKPLKSRRIFFQITDLPPQKQREAVAVLLAKFPYISPQFFVSMLQNKDAYINIVCTKYPRGMHKVCISLERLTRLRAAGAQEEEKQQKLAEKRRAEIRLNPGLQTRRLRAKPLKLLRDYHILELVEKENI